MNGEANDSEVKSLIAERLAGGLAYEYPLSKRSTLYGFGAVSVDTLLTLPKPVMAKLLTTPGAQVLDCVTTSNKASWDK